MHFFCQLASLSEHTKRLAQLHTFVVCIFLKASLCISWFSRKCGSAGASADLCMLD